MSDDEEEEGQQRPFQNVTGDYPRIQVDTTTPEVSRKAVDFLPNNYTHSFSYVCQFQAAAEANAREIMAIPAEQVAGRSTAANRQAADDAEKELFERAGLDPPDEDEGLTDGQRMLAATEYKHLSATDILKLNTKWTKQATGQIMGFRKELSGFRTVQQMHSKTLHDLCDTLAAIKRQLSNFEKHGILPGELAANPDLNPLLCKSSRKRVGFRTHLLTSYFFHSFSATHLPFNTQEQVLKFFDSWECTVALQKYVTRNQDFEQRGFVLGMIRMLCTPDYRRQYSYPVGQLYENLTYIPARLVENASVSNCFLLLKTLTLSFRFKKFIVATTQTAADKANAFMRLKDIERQARVAFQSSQVDKEADWEHAHLPKEDRPKREFSSSEDSESAEPAKKKKKQPKKAAKGKKAEDKKKEDE